MILSSSHDVAVIGAGVFGAWTAYELQRTGRSVLLIDAYGPGHGRASSGGETRLIRMGYGAEELYTRWSARSLERWSAFFAERDLQLFQDTGVLWLAYEGDEQVGATEATLRRVGVRYERLGRDELERRYPQVDFGSVAWGLLEPESGVLIARRAVQALVRAVVQAGAEYRIDVVHPPAETGGGTLSRLTTGNDRRIHAATYVFACGPWLPRLFPAILDGRIFTTRQEVFFFGVPPGDRRFAPPLLPAWLDLREAIYGIPDLEHRGLKIASDRHGPPFDPDSGCRTVSPEAVEPIRTYLARRFPDLAGAPVVETRVCQYENSSNGDFLVDRHPELTNVWLVGAGSGHGFKHGPAVGEHVARLIEGTASPDRRFALATKETIRKRKVF